MRVHMAENPDIEEAEHYFFLITPSAPNRSSSELLSDLRGDQTAGVVQLEDCNILCISFLLPNRGSDNWVTQGIQRTPSPVS